MLLAPALGLALGAVAALIVWAVPEIAAGPFSALLAATLAVTFLAGATRALHLDGLADTSDALGSGRRGEDAIRIARSGDVGPFGVVALVLVLIVEIAALATVVSAGQAAGSATPGAAAAIIGVATGRLAATTSCVRGIPAARPEGLGATVAGCVPRSAAITWTIALAVLAAGLMAAGAPDSAAAAALVGALAVLVGLAAALLLVRRAVRRLGGITGDVLGAAIEVATAVAVTVLALGSSVAL